MTAPFVNPYGASLPLPFGPIRAERLNGIHPVARRSIPGKNGTLWERVAEGKRRPLRSNVIRASWALQEGRALERMEGLRPAPTSFLIADRE